MGYIFIFIILFLSFFSLSHLCGQRYTSIFALLLIFCIAGFSYSIPDYSAYERFFQNASYLDIDKIFNYSYAIENRCSKDFGYNILSYILGNLGMNFVCFRALIFLVGFFLLYCYARRMSKYTMPFLSLYCLYPLLIDVIQMRNFMMEICVFVAFFYYCKDNSFLSSDIKWFGILLIASTLHSSAFMLLPFFIFNKIITTRYKYFIYIYIAACLCLPVYSSEIRDSWLFVYFLLSSGDSFLNSYADYTLATTYDYNVWLYIYTVILYICSCLFQFYKNLRTDMFTEYESRYIDTLKRYLMYNICFLPLYPLFSTIATRLPRNSLILVYIVICICMGKVSVKYKYLLWGLGICLALAMGRLDLYHPEMIYNIDLIMNNNFIFEFFGI